MLSATQRRRKAWQLTSWASGRVRPKAGNDARAGVMGRGERRSNAGRGEEVGCRAESEKKENFLFFFFLFKSYKAFPNDFET
jgi:hypothetical protein